MLTVCYSPRKNVSVMRPKVQNEVILNYLSIVGKNGSFQGADMGLLGQKITPKCRTCVITVSKHSFLKRAVLSCSSVKNIYIFVNNYINFI